MKKRFILLAATVLLLQTPWVIYAQDNKVVDKIIEISKADNQTMNHLDMLVNRIGGRPIGSDAYQSATTWAATLFKQWGLEVEIQEVGELPVGFNRGPWFGKMLDNDGMTLHFATPSYTAGTKGVQRGHVVAEPKTRRQFENMKGKLNGAWVLISGTNDGWPIDISERGEARRKEIIEKNEAISRYNDSITRINRANPNNPPIPLKALEEAPALFYKEMVEAGILGTIQSSAVPIRALYARSYLMDLDFYTNLPTCPDIKLDENQYKIIAQKVAERRYFQLEFDIRNHFRPGPVKYHNVIGKIRGTEFPDEYVMSGGHLDAFDVATGGVDCGTGVAPNLEAARLIMAAGGKPKRTILFCLWAAEEFGLWGSKYWVENNKDKWPHISNYFNRDGGPTVANSITVPPAMYDDFKKATERLDEINPDFPFTLNRRMGDPPPRPTTPGGSDHAYFTINGMPAISFGTADPKGYDFLYSEIWHTERDTYNMSIPEYMDHTSVVMAIVLYNLAMQDKTLSREGLYREDAPAPPPQNTRRR
ncbi:MAG: M20/M25/M40 family metallo-hydrolase [Bacteroidales bacterium]|nr:M20/M25/M40 family metallo-hydrolase [Bacteroidales bacterium]